MRYLLTILLLLVQSAVAGAVTAGFTVDYAAGCAPHVVHFTNTSTGAVSYSWNLGNGTITPVTNPSTSYLAVGTYTATLTAYGADGSTDTHTMLITVHPLPTVSFSAADTSICPGEAVSFINTSSSGVPGPMTWLWNFGDGSTSTVANPVHTFSTPGFYNITLTVTNSQGCVRTLTRVAYVHVFTPPAVNFAGSPLNVCNPPGSVTFTSTGSGTAPLSYLWTFGAGIMATGSPASNIYSAPGTYDVKLVVTDGNGCKDSLTRPAYVFVGSINAAFTGPASGCVFSPVSFSNTSSVHTARSWNYGDGTPIDTSFSGMHVYTAPGTYTVTLTILSGPCNDVETHTITIHPRPVGDFTFTPTDPCPAPVNISYTSVVPPGSSVTWLYSDGTSATGPTDTHNWATDGVKTIKMVISDVNGCIDTVMHRDTLYDLTFVGIATPTMGCVPLDVHFSSAAYTMQPDTISHPYPYGISGYTWNFGDGSPASTATAPNHTYTAVGVYVVTVTATTDNGCPVTDTLLIKVGAPPEVTFTAAPTHICYGDSVVFTATVITGPVDAYLWEFGDGSLYATSPGAVHYYNTPGFYTATVTPYYHGCPGPPYVWPVVITVDSPKAIIYHSFPCSPLTRVNFVDSSMGDDTHIWFFGDGTSSTADDPVHDYPAIGVYTVSLATYNAASGCRDTAYAVINLLSPVVNFTADDTTVCEGDAVNFTATVTGGTISAATWFVNGHNDPWQVGMHMRDTFNVSGLYSIMFTFLNDRFCPDTVIRDNYVIVGKPVANFTVAPVPGCWPLTVTFTDISTDVPGLFMTGFQWDFGDGSGATVSTPVTTHTYTNPGTYSVTEIVTDNIGCMDTAAHPSAVIVYKPDAVFTASNVHPCINVPITFNNASVAIVSSFWMFGDGTTSTATSPVHAYTAAGSYTVKLVVTDVHGCTDTQTNASYINVTQPVASFTPSDTFSVCSPLTVAFTNTSTGGMYYDWTFGDGNASAFLSPTNVYVAPGLYTATLIVRDYWGCADTASRVINIYGYAGSLTYAPLTGCAPLEVHFHAAISNVPGIIWDFGDGNTSVMSAVDSAVHIYTVPGGYVPKLILSDNTGCQNSALGDDAIKVDGITAKFDVSPAACLGTEFHFVDSSTFFWMPIDSWDWTYGPGITSTDSSPAWTVYDPGIYPVTLTVSNAWGCTATLVSSLEVLPLPVVSASADTVVCVGDPASLEAWGAATYEWEPAATVSCVTCNPTSATPPVVITYTVTGTDEKGCKDTSAVTVGLRTHTFANAWGDSVMCSGNSVPLFDTGGTKYTWLPPGGLSDPAIWNPIAFPASTITYTVIAQLAGCIPDTDYVKVQVFPAPRVDAGPDQEVMSGSSVQLAATGINTAAWEWTPPQGLDCYDCSDPEATVTTTTTYVVTGISPQGCRHSDSVTIFVFCNSKQVFLPNTFTPNDDGENDVFYPRGTGISIIKSFRIYNRWGELLFERRNINVNDASNAWDGNYNGDYPRPDVYVYVVEAVCYTGQPVLIKGDVTIIR